MGSFEHERLLTPAEVAALFRVDPKTVTRWAQAGKLTAIRTLGGTGAIARVRSAGFSKRADHRRAPLITANAPEP